ATMYKFAEKHKVKYILTGGNISTECVRNPLDYFYYGTDLWQIRDIHGRFGQAPLVNFPLSGILRHKVYLRYFKGFEVVKPLDELQGYMEAPRKSYKDYKNQLYLFLLGARVMQLMGLEERAVKR